MKNMLIFRIIWFQVKCRLIPGICVQSVVVCERKKSDEMDKVIFEILLVDQNSLDHASHNID